MRKSENGAFTLIELILVIALIGLLSTTVFASYTSSRLKSRASVYKAEIANNRLQVVSDCYDRSLVSATDVPATGAHPQGVIMSQICGVEGEGVFSITFDGALNNDTCTEAVMTETGVTYADC